MGWAITIRWFVFLTVTYIALIGGLLGMSVPLDFSSDSSESDNKTEESIVCPSDEFPCSEGCIPESWRCDDEEDCNDGSDEGDFCAALTTKCSHDEFQCNNSQCLNGILRCNGVYDCTDGSDEVNCSDCLLNNGGCSQICEGLSSQFYCDCYPGYELHGNSSCEIGHGALLLGNSRGIRMIDLKTFNYSLTINDLRSTVAVDYHYAENLLFWINTEDKSIYSAKIGEKNSNMILKGDINNLEGIAVDWIHNHIYWTNAGMKTINVASLDGKLRKLLFGTNLNKPRAIVVNPLDGWMYWCDWGIPPKIEKSGMDGSHRSTIVSKDIHFPNGLTIDFVSKKLFWADARYDNIHSSDYDGTNVKIVLSSNIRLSHPFALDVFEDWLYWTDWNNRGINRADKFTGENVQTVVPWSTLPMGIRVYHPYKQPNGTNYCGPLNGNCSHMCLPAPQISAESAKYTCACPDGMALTDNKQTCFTAISTQLQSAVESATKEIPEMSDV